MPKKHVNKTGQKRVRNHDMRKRIDEIKNWILAGVPRIEILCSIEVAYKIASSRAYAYVQKAEKEIHEIANLNREQWLAEHIAIRRGLRRRANESGDIKFELECAVDEAKILGLYAPIKQEITGRDGAPIQHGHTGNITVEHKLSEDLESLTDAFLSAANREKKSDLRSDDPAEPVDTGLHQNGDDKETN